MITFPATNVLSSDVIARLYGVIPSGVKDGVNTLYTLPSFRTDSVALFHNGRRLLPGVDYATPNNTTIEFLSFSPAAESEILADYVPA